MAVSPAVQQTEERIAEYEEMESEYRACQQHLRSKEQALRILQDELKKADLNSQRLKQEISQLRSQLSRSNQMASPKARNSPTKKMSSENKFSLLSEELVQEKEMLIQQLEGAQKQICELEAQVKQLEEEKEEFKEERDYFSIKCESLVKCLEEEKKLQPPSHSALQTTMEENRQLKLALVEAESEREHARGRVERYKKAIERRKTIEAAAEQVQNNSTADKKQDWKLAMKRIAELESLANSLSQSVKEKSVTITHQKKANKVLATRITELEHQVKVQEVCGGGAPPTNCREEVENSSVIRACNNSVT